MSAETDIGERPEPPAVLPVPALHLADHPWSTSPPSRWTWATKAIVDITGALAILTLTAPLMLATAALIRVRLGRGVIFRQRRIGMNGREFTVFKFRTMGPDRRVAAAIPRQSGDRRNTHKTTADPRHTPLGRTLRRLSIDELPQLVNVLRREMSLIGPRPELPWLVARYEPWQHHRHLVRPGLTGLWQVTARGEGPMENFTAIDVDYVRDMSVRSDLAILARTLPALLTRHGA